MGELKYYLSEYKPGDVVKLSVKRDGHQRLMKVTLREEVKHMKECNVEERKEKEEKIMVLPRLKKMRNMIEKNYRNDKK